MSAVLSVADQQGPEGRLSEMAGPDEWYCDA